MSTDIFCGHLIPIGSGEARPSVLRGLLACSAKWPGARPNVPRGLPSGVVSVAGALGWCWGLPGASGYHVGASVQGVLDPKPPNADVQVGVEARRRNRGVEGEYPSPRTSFRLNSSGD